MKKYCLIVLSFILVFTIVSCQTSDPDYIILEDTPTTTVSPTPTYTPTITVTQSPTSIVTPAPTITPVASPVPMEVIVTLESGTKVYAFGGGSGTFEFDLNGDGVNDVISYEFEGMTGIIPADAITLDSPIDTSHIYEAHQCNLMINDQPIIIQGEVMAGLILVIDIDSTDSTYEIAIPEYGPSHDPFTAFITYDGVSPQSIGKLYDNPLISLRIDGSSEITGLERGQKLHTWFYDAIYIVQNGLLIEYRENGYVLMNSNVTAKVSLPLQVSPTDPTLAYTLSPGEEVVITLTDDARWFCVQNSSGQTGWFEVEDFHTINSLPATDIFEGLFMAD